MLTIEKNDSYEDIALLLKFGKKKHIESLVDGNINVNNIGFYVEQELRCGVAGIGDKHDGATLIKDFTIKDIKPHSCEMNENNIINRILDDIVNNHFKVDLAIHRNVDKRTPIFCAMGIKKEELENRNGKLVLKFTTDEIKKLKEDFKDYTDVFITTAGIFAQKVLKKANEEKIFVNMDQVRYYDENINQSERMNDAFRDNIIFWKKECFSSQREFRIAFPGVCINERIDLINIGNLKDISLVLGKDEVLDEDFELEFIVRT